MEHLSIDTVSSPFLFISNEYRVKEKERSRNNFSTFRNPILLFILMKLSFHVSRTVHYKSNVKR